MIEENVNEETDQILNNSDVEGAAIVIIEDQEVFTEHEDTNEKNRCENQILNTDEAGQEYITMEINQDQLEDVTDTDQEASTMETDQNDGDDITAQKTSQEQTKKKRALGLPYMGYKRSGLKVMNNIPKPQRTLKNRCSHKSLEKPTPRSFLCATFTDEDRIAAFNKFWKFQSWKEKRAYVKGLVTSRCIIRRRKNERQTLRKNEGHDVYLQVKNGNKLKVCRIFF